MSSDKKYPICECANYYGTGEHHPECPVLKRIEELVDRVEQLENERIHGMAIDWASAPDWANWMIVQKSTGRAIWTEDMRHPYVGIYLDVAPQEQNDES